jgi:PilZ domain
MEPDKRQHIRKRTDQLLYAEFGPENGSILLNLSEEGCSFQSLAPVHGEQVRFSVSVGDGHKLEGDGQMVWSGTGKKTGGVRFLNPSRELREQVRTWLNQTLVTTDGKLDPAAVEPEAKRRRRKLREEARAEAGRVQKEVAPKGTTAEKPSEESPPAPTASTPNTNETSTLPRGNDAGAGATGNSAVTPRRIGTIALAVLFFMGLATYRRELGHLVMSVGSSIAGEKGGPAAPAQAGPAGQGPASPSSGVKAVTMTDAHDTATESSAGAGDNANGGDTRNVGDAADTEMIQPSEVSAAPARHVPTQQARATEDVSSLWTSVENGDTGAEVMLATRYVRGEGVPQSCAQARVLLEAAMKRGNSAAKQKLSELGQAGCP